MSGDESINASQSNRSTDNPVPEAPQTDDKHDPMGPPEVPCECYCLHCQRMVMSDKMWFQKVIGDPQGFEGFWMCPTPNCDGAGFCFDLMPVDPQVAEQYGCQYFDDDGDEEDFDDDEFDDEDDDEIEDEIEFEFEDQFDEPEEYDPAESKYKNLDLEFGDGEDDLIEGDEWKLGVAPDQPVPPQMYWPEAQRLEWEEEQKKYDGPDLRPREVDWSDREDRDQNFKEDDIPF